MASTESQKATRLPLRAGEIRMLEQAFVEAREAISLSEAKRLLEQKSVASLQNNELQLANPDLKPLAFALRRRDLKTIRRSILREIYQWAIFILFMPPILLLSLLLARFGVSYKEYLRQARSMFKINMTEAQRSRQNAIKNLSIKKEAPILFLRSFSFHFGDASLPVDDPRVVEERVADAFKLCGPTLAVADPNEAEGSMPGPLRLHFDNDIWRAGVIYLMSISQYVVIQIGNTPGTLWELIVAWSRLTPEKVIISLADPANPDARDLSTWQFFQPYLEEVIGWEIIYPRTLLSVMYIGFGENWEPRLYSSKWEVLRSKVAPKKQFVTRARGEWLNSH